MKIIKNLITLIIVASLALTIQAQDITNTPGTDGDFVINSTTGGLLIPTMTQTQRDAIGSPATGLMIYQTDATPGYYYNAGTAGTPNWVAAMGAKSINDLSNGKTGNSSVYLGQEAAVTASGGQNTAIGYNAGTSLTSGAGNILIGKEAGYDITTGDDNIAITVGPAGLFEGNESILIGKFPTSIHNYNSNSMNIGDLIYGEDIYTASGKVGIGHGNHSPTSTLHIGGSHSVKIVGAHEDYTPTDTDYIIVFDTHTAACTLSLPPMEGRAGRVYIVVNNYPTHSERIITITTHGTEAINGYPNDVKLGQGKSSNGSDNSRALTIMCDGSVGWWVISGDYGN